MTRRRRWRLPGAQMPPCRGCVGMYGPGSGRRINPCQTFEQARAGIACMSLDQLDEAIGIAGGKCLAHQAVLRLGVLQTELIQAVAAATGELQAATARGIDAPIDLISSEIAAGREVGITGFGSFKASTRAERTGRNPRTGEPLTIAASKSSKFVPGATLKTALNGGAK